MVEDKVFIVHSSVVPDEKFHPGVSLFVALGAEDMARVITARPFLCFDDKECVTIFLFFICRGGFVRAMLPSNLRPCDLNGAKMLTATLYIEVNVKKKRWGRLKDPYAVVVLKNGTLQNKESSLPSSKVLSPFRQITFLVPNLHHWLLGLLYDIRSEERDNLVIGLDWELNQRLEVLL